MLVVSNREPYLHNLSGTGPPVVQAAPTAHGHGDSSRSCGLLGAPGLHTAAAVAIRGAQGPWTASDHVQGADGAQLH